MSAESSLPFQALVYCALAVVLATAVTAAVSRIPARAPVSGRVAVEVDPGGGRARVMLFEKPPDRCEALKAGGDESPDCVAGTLLQSGNALFVMPGGGIRDGWIGGKDLIVLGLPIPVNVASDEDLVAIPGVGPSIAAAIVKERVRSGPFKSAGDLERVRGVGPKKAAAIDRYVSYSPARP